MVIVKLTTIAILFSFASCAPAADFSREATGVWERMWGSDSHIATVSAPDKNSSVLIKLIKGKNSDSVALTFHYDDHRHMVNIGPGVGTEILWAPDSSAVAVTASDGGRNGIYTAKVYRLKAAGIEEIDLTPTIRAAFGTGKNCDWPEPPNVVAIAWRKGSSSEILFAAQVVRHTVCKDPGRFSLYEYSLDKKRITQSWKENEAKQLFGSELGDFLMQ